MEWFDSKSWKLQITRKTRVSKFCLLMGLCWRLARRLKATLNLHWLEDTCLAVCILNMLAQLIEQSPGASSLRTRLPEGSLREESIKLRTVWPWDSFCPKTVYGRGVDHESVTHPAALQLLHRQCWEMLYWFNLCKTVRWVLSSLSYKWGSWGSQRYAKVT